MMPFEISGTILRTHKNLIENHELCGICAYLSLCWVLFLCVTQSWLPNQAIAEAEGDSTSPSQGWSSKILWPSSIWAYTDLIV